MRDTERPQVVYDREVIKAALADVPAPPSSAKPTPRLSIDLSAIPPWGVKKIPVREKRTSDAPKPLWVPPGKHE